MQHKAVLDGHDLRSMFSAGADWLEKLVPDINALNVYPVPDGDCGTNMLLTMRASLNQVAKLNDDREVSSFAGAIARGALLGARGNSGVILSQIWRGFSLSLEGKRNVDAMNLAVALEEASATAYQALTNPVEGTILTVIKEAASAASMEAASPEASLQSVLEAAVNAARTSVLDTPNLLSVLKNAGVVDAGGHGFFTFLEGALLRLKGNKDNRSPELLATRLPLVTTSTSEAEESDRYGFCTQFILRGQDLDIATVRGLLENMGKSLIVVGDSSMIRVHIHTLDPDNVTRTVSSFGALLDIDIRNMDDQHIEFLMLRREKTKTDIAVIAVASGDGIVRVFADLNACAIVPGGQTMNPSTFDILRTVEEVPSDKVIILPNNKNVIPAARLVQSLTKKEVSVVLTESIPQGIAALIDYTPEDSFEANIERMTKAITEVKTIEIARATRDTRANDLTVKIGQAIGLIDGELLSTGDLPADAIFQALERIDLKQAGLITIYYGKDIDGSEAAKTGALIREQFGIEVSVVDGGQPAYDYIISIE